MFSMGKAEQEKIKQKRGSRAQERQLYNSCTFFPCTQLQQGQPQKKLGDGEEQKEV
jgi:hypothetical protein